ncbi:hypothetical protein, partial [Rhizorhabdus argentea]|uniref:hypothetical protein n=1 Tax=Rhizorhabdus argentea TaxID=1387174 RepID=UPI0030ECE6CF
GKQLPCVFCGCWNDGIMRRRHSDPILHLILRQDLKYQPPPSAATHALKRQSSDRRHGSIRHLPRESILDRGVNIVTGGIWHDIRT